MEVFIPKFDENGHQRFDEQTYQNPTYPDLLNVLNDCVSVLRDVNVAQHMFETYANVLMNAESMLIQALTHYEINQREAYFNLNK